MALLSWSIPNLCASGSSSPVRPSLVTSYAWLCSPGYVRFAAVPDGPDNGQRHSERAA